MFGAIAFAILVISLLGMGLVAWLYEKYEVPLHARPESPPAEQDLLLIRKAKRTTKAGDPRLN
jgi:hypothetical protein